MQHPIPDNPSFQDLTGKKFGKLTVLHYAGKSKKRYSLWHCVCECGNTHDVVATSLTKGLTRSCTRCPKDRPVDRACNKCGIVFPFTEEFFYKHPAFAFGLRPQCKTCIAAAMRVSGKRHRDKARKRVLEHYSGGTPQCACCKEQTEEFLSLDHIGGGGRKHRAEVGTGIYSRLCTAGFPPGYRILCHNCNMARGVYGYCPHRNLPEDRLE